MKNTYMQFRISDREKEALQARAKQLEMSASEYIMYLVRKDIDKEKETK